MRAARVRDGRNVLRVFLRAVLAKEGEARASRAAVMTGSGPAAVQHHSTAFLAHATQLKLALIILNTDERLKGEASNDLFSHLWEQATVRVCADGAANRLHDALSTERRAVLSSQRIAPAERCSNLLPPSAGASDYHPLTLRHGSCAHGGARTGGDP